MEDGVAIRRTVHFAFAKSSTTNNSRPLAGHANAHGIDISIQNVSPVGRRIHELAVSIMDTRRTNDIF